MKKVVFKEKSLRFAYRAALSKQSGGNTGCGAEAQLNSAV
jgi:hypothetical protein